MSRFAFSCLILGLIFCAGAAAEPASTPASTPGTTPTSVPGSIPASWYAGGAGLSIQQKLATANKQLTLRGSEIEKEVQQLEATLKELDAKPADASTAAQKEKLTSRRAGLQNELSSLQTKVSSYRAAADGEDSALQFREELKQFKALQAKRPASLGPAEIEALQAELAQAQTIKETLQRLNASRIQRLGELHAVVEKVGAGKDPALEAQHDALLAQVEASLQSCAASDAKIELLLAKLPANAAVAPRQVLTSRAADEKAIEERQKLAEAARNQARNALEEARQKRKDTLDRLTQLTAKGEDTIDAENDYEFWSRRYDYEIRRTRLAEAEARAAGEKRKAAQILSQIDAARATLEQLQKAAATLSPPERNKQAADLRSSVVAAEEDAKLLDRQAGESVGADFWLDMLKGIEAKRKAIEERQTKLLSAWDDQSLPTERDDSQTSQAQLAHLRRMRDLLDTERQQVGAGMNIMEATLAVVRLQASLKRQLAGLYTQCADLLAPPQPGFWQRQRSTINAIKIFLSALAAVYALNLAVWLAQRAARSMAAGFARGRFSVKRIETLLKFFASILKLFIWLFAIILVLNEYGIDPAKSTGAIGLVGLILAGMFQQIVIDIVKGLDIITGRHYNVGDFVELDGKSGHVIDFSMTHTRIRTASGQEYNLPNSKCIPSRRYPDGYVDNYVDLAVKSASDVHQARKALAPVCRHLSRRIEQVKEEPRLSDKFAGARPGSVMLRYRVRVLPASDWVISSQFIPAAKAALAAEGIELAEEPTVFFLNRIQTFRQLFSRELTEEEILREASESDRPVAPDQPPAPAGADTAQAIAETAQTLAEGAHATVTETAGSRN